MSIKLDMSKTYDRIEWCFLENVMLKLGFDRKKKRVAMVMSYITLVSYRILLDGVPTSPFCASIGCVKVTLYQEIILSYSTC